MRLDRLTLEERRARAEEVMLAEHATQRIDPDDSDLIRAAQTARILEKDPGTRATQEGR